MEENAVLSSGRYVYKRQVLERVEVFIEELRVELVPNLMKESWWYVRKLISAAAFLGVGFIASLLLCRDYDSLMQSFRQSGKEAGEREKPGNRLLTAVLAACLLYTSRCV